MRQHKRDAKLIKLFIYFICEIKLWKWINLTKCIDTFSWEINSSSASQEILHVLWESKVHFRVHKTRPTIPVLSQMNPVRVLPSYFFKIRSDVVPTAPDFQVVSFLQVPPPNSVCMSRLLHTCSMTHPSHSSRQYRPICLGLLMRLVYYDTVLVVAVVRHWCWFWCQQ